MSTVMSRPLITWETWTLVADADRRFRRIVVSVALPALLLAIAVAFFKSVEAPHPQPEFQPERYVQLLPPVVPVQSPPPPQRKPAQEPPPANERQVRVPQPKPIDRQVRPLEKPRQPEQPAPTAEQKIEAARQKAAQSQEMTAIRDQLADLRNQTVNADPNSNLRAETVITSKGAATSSAGRPAFEETVSQGSNGIGSAGASSVSQTQNGTGLGQRLTSVVRAPGGINRRGANGISPDALAGGRTLVEIQQEFDRTKGSFYALFSRAARENPAIGSGKIVINLTIAADGSVVSCQLVSSTFGEPELEHKIIEKIKSMNFGPKSGPPFTARNYPINYIPN